MRTTAARRETDSAREERWRAVGNDEHQGRLGDGESSIREAVRSFSVGSSYEWSYGGKVDAGGFDGHGKSEVRLDRTDNGYEVRSSGELGASIGYERSGPGQDDMEANAGVFAKATAVYRYETPEGAADAASAHIQAHVIASAPPVAPILGVFADRDLPMRIADVRHLSGFEVQGRGVLDAEIEGELMSARIETSGMQKVSVDFDKGAVVEERELSAALSGDFIKTVETCGGEFEMNPFANGGVDGRTRLVTTYELTPEMIADIKSGRRSTAAVIGEAAQTPKRELVFSAGAEGAVRGSGVRFEVEKRVPFGPGELSSAVDELKRPAGYNFSAAIVEHPDSGNWKIGVERVSVAESERITSVVARGSDAGQVVSDLTRLVSDRSSAAASQAFARIKGAL